MLWLGRCLVAYALLVVVSVVMCGFHYVSDAAVGVVAGVVCYRMVGAGGGEEEEASTSVPPVRTHTSNGEPHGGGAHVVIQLASAVPLWATGLTSTKTEVRRSWVPAFKGLVRSGDPLALFYAVSPFFYSVAGLVLLLNADMHAERVSPTHPWRLDAVLLLLQGVISFASDVARFGVDSRMRVLDRFFASTLTLSAIPKMAVWWLGWWGFLPMPTPCAAAAACLFPVGIVAFLNSRLACKTGTLRAFLWWHSAWHVIFPGLVCVLVWFVVRPLGGVRGTVY